MKKLKFKITRNLKTAMLVSSMFLIGGIGAKSKNALALVPVFGLVSGLKKKNFQMSDEEENLMKGIEGEINDWAAKLIEGSITKEQFDEQMDAVKLKATNVIIGEGESAKSIADILRDQGVEIENLKKMGGQAKAAEINLLGQLTKMKEDIRKVFNEKHGFVEINITKDPAVMTTQNTVDYDTNSIPVEAMESFSLGALAMKRYGKQFIANLADRITVTDMEKYTIWDEEGDVEGAFAIVAEGGLKPLLSADIVKNFAQAQKVAGKYIVTEEFEKFFKRAYTIIQRIIRDKMFRDYEALLRTAFAAVDVAYTGTTLDGTFVSPNDYDAIGAVAAQIESLNFIPDTLVLNPQDKWRIRLSKDAEGRYLFPVVTQNGETRIFEFNIVTSTYQTAGTFTLAESGLFKIEEETMTVRIGYGINVTESGGNVTSVQADFDHNRRRVIVETWFKAYLPTPYIGSAVTATFNTVKAALLAGQV